MFSDELLKTLAEDGGQSNGPPVILLIKYYILIFTVGHLQNILMEHDLYLIF